MTSFDELKEMPHGLDRALLRVLSFHMGREAAISRGGLVGELARMGFRVHERQMRLCINQLRNEGTLICSTGGKDGGYWLAANWEEILEFMERELHSRAMDLLSTEKALKESAERKWGVYKNQMVLNL